eukprot:TRINITY_DN29039_c0_g1_i1.p1 TRINITY_DN29039_c0_g1~~TRINITY_DN29039_c0_g1_i1.p1  ORF type:complete len:107 (+),score=14.12 TRINITY_DN29039_c0_g1_i1:66-386(+)
MQHAMRSGTTVLLCNMFFLQVIALRPEKEFELSSTDQIRRPYCACTHTCKVRTDIFSNGLPSCFTHRLAVGGWCPMPLTGLEVQVMPSPKASQVLRKVAGKLQASS